PYGPLPRAPTRWGTQSGRAHPQMQEAEALFELRDAPWQLAICAAFAAVALADSLSTRWAAIRLSSSTVVGSSASRGRRTAARFISISMLGFLPREFLCSLVVAPFALLEFAQPFHFAGMQLFHSSLSARAGARGVVSDHQG